LQPLPDSQLDHHSPGTLFPGSYSNTQFPYNWQAYQYPPPATSVYDRNFYPTHIDSENVQHHMPQIETPDPQLHSQTSFPGQFAPSLDQQTPYYAAGSSTNFNEENINTTCCKLK
jgi:hypothetical protein